jgi:hypothetical protein
MDSSIVNVSTQRSNIALSNGTSVINGIKVGAKICYRLRFFMKKDD